MRRRAVLERRQKLLEALRHLLFGVAKHAEHSLLQFAVVDADAAAGELFAVGYQVVEPPDCLARIAL